MKPFLISLCVRVLQQIKALGVRLWDQAGWDRTDPAST